MVVRAGGAEKLRAIPRPRIKSPPHSVVLLAGGAGLLEFSQAIERSVLDLPVDQGLTLFDHWQRQIRELSTEIWSDRVDVRIVGGTVPSGFSSANDLAMEHIEETRELRGTGGILRDLTDGFPDDHYLLVASAATLLLEPLAPLAAELYSAQSDVAFFVDDQNVAANLMLIRCGCLRGIPDVGFVDFKEQALPRIAAASAVTVLRRNAPIAASMRTPMEYLRALRVRSQRAQQRTQHSRNAGIFAEDWQPMFGIVEPGSNVAPDAGIHDSVVLRGTKVGAGAVLVRSLICPGGSVPVGSVVVDQIIPPATTKQRSRH